MENKKVLDHEASSGYVLQVKCHILKGPKINSLSVSSHHGLCSHDSSPFIWPDLN